MRYRNLWGRDGTIRTFGAVFAGVVRHGVVNGIPGIGHSGAATDGPSQPRDGYSDGRPDRSMGSGCGREAPFVLFRQTVWLCGGHSDTAVAHDGRYCGLTASSTIVSYALSWAIELYGRPSICWRFGSSLSPTAWSRTDANPARVSAARRVSASYRN
jgi:hypothetical protein